MRIITCDARDCSWNYLGICTTPNIHIIEKDAYAYCDSYTTWEIEISPEAVLKHLQNLMETLRLKKERENERETNCN